MPIGPDVAAGLADLLRGTGGAHRIAVAKEAQSQYLTELEQASGPALHVVHACKRHPLSLYRLVNETQPGIRDHVEGVVVCVLEPRRCDTTTRVAVDLQPARLGSLPVLWIVVADAEEAPQPSLLRPSPTSWPPPPPQRAGADDVNPPLSTETLMAAGAALGRRFTVNELGTSLQQPTSALVDALEVAIDSGVLYADSHELAFASERAWRAVRKRQEPVQWSQFVGAAIHSHVASRSVDRLRDLLVDGELDDLRPDVFTRVWDVLSRSDFLAAAELCRRRAARRPHSSPEAEELEARALLLEIQSGLPEVIPTNAAKLAHDHPTAVGTAIAEALVVPYPYEAMQLALRTIQSAEPGTADHARLHALVATCRSLIGGIDPADLDRVTAIASATGDRRALSMASFAVAVSVAEAGDPLAVLSLVASNNEAPANETLGPTGWLSGTFRAKTLVDLGRIAESEQVIDACADYVERRGQVAALPHVIMSRAVFAMEQGRLLDAAHGLQAARHIGLAIGLVEFSEANILSRLIQLARMRGDIAELDRLGATLETHLQDDRTRLDAVDKGLALAEDPEPSEWTPRWANTPAPRDAPITESPATKTPANLTADENSPDLAPEAADGRRGGYSMLLALHDLLAIFRTSILQNNLTEGAEAYDVLIQVGQTTGMSFPQALANHARGLSVGNPDRVAAAMATYKDLRRPLLEVQALEDLAYLAPDRAQSVSALVDARETWQSMGANREAARMDRYLRSLGVRSVAVPDANPVLNLTAAEQRVVRELMGGRSNAEIAEALQLSKNTVAVHLSRIYARSGVTGRAALVDLVRSLEQADR